MAARVGPRVLVSVLAMAASSVPLVRAQQDAAALPSLSGTWTLNFEASSASSDVVKTAPTPPPPDPPAHPVGPGGTTDGASSPRGPLFNDPTKTGSLIPPSVNSALNPTDPPKDKGRKLTSEERLLLELTTPPSTLKVTVAPDAVTMTREGRTDIYKTNGQEEKHKLINGTVKTKTYWVNQTLRQELTAGDLRLARTMELDADKRLIVITKPADDKSLMFETTLISRLGTDATSKGRKRAVYDAEK